MKLQYITCLQTFAIHALFDEYTIDERPTDDSKSQEK